LINNINHEEKKVKIDDNNLMKKRKLFCKSRKYNRKKNIELKEFDILRKNLDEIKSKKVKGSNKKKEIIK
jgi:hypothetical protein